MFAPIYQISAFEEIFSPLQLTELNIHSKFARLLNCMCLHMYFFLKKKNRINGAKFPNEWFNTLDLIIRKPNANGNGLKLLEKASSVFLKKHLEAFNSFYPNSKNVFHFKRIV